MVIYPWNVQESRTWYKNIQLYGLHMLVFINDHTPNFFYHKLYRKYIVTQRTVPQFVSSYFHAHSVGIDGPPNTTMG
jgi:hypothetical protein